LIDEIRRVAIELDPDFAQRQHDHAVSLRRVRGAIGRDGTGHITAEGMSADQIAAACDRLDAIGWHLKRAGHPGKLDHLRTDVFAGLLTGQFAGLTDEQLLERLLATIPSDPQPSTSDPDECNGEHTGEPDSDEQARADQRDGATQSAAGQAAAPAEAGGGSEAGDCPPADDRGQCLPAGTPQGGAPPGAGSDPPHPGSGEQSGGGLRLHRRGLRLWAALGTIAGRDRRPSELLGWGPLHAELARQIAAAPTASWWYALTDRKGRPIQVGPVRRRPTGASWPGEPVDVGGVEVWLQLTAGELAELVAHPPPGWEPLIGDIRRRVTNSSAGAPNGDPTDRFPNAGLRRFLAMRDRRCMFPGCRIPSHRCQADHTIDHARGGPTIDTNMSTLCAGDHALKTNHGWQARPKAAGHLIWVSPMGHEYERRPPRGPTHARPPMANPSRSEDDWFRELTDEEYEDLFGLKPRRVSASLLESKWWTDTCLTADDQPDPDAPRRPEPGPRPEPEPRSKKVPVMPKPSPEDDIIPF
jgi:hypothetical protein